MGIGREFAILLIGIVLVGVLMAELGWLLH